MFLILKSTSVLNTHLMTDQDAWPSFHCYVGSRYDTSAANTSFGNTALSALVFTRLVSKAFSWGLDDRCSHAFCHAVIREQGRGRLIKEGFLLSVCLVSFPLIQRRTCSSVKRSQMYPAWANNVSPPATAVVGNSTAPTPVCLTPKTVRISVNYSKVTTGENWPWCEVVAQNDVRKECDSSVSFCDGHTAYMGQLEMVGSNKELLKEWSWIAVLEGVQGGR